MAVTAKLFGKFPQNLGGGDAAGDGPMDLLSDTIKEILTDNTDTVSQTADEVKADRTGEIAATGGYAAGGHTLGTKTYVASSLVTRFFAADQTYAASTITAYRSDIYDDTPTTPADPLILNRDFGGVQTTTGTDFVIDNDGTNGIFAVTVA